MEHSTGFSPVAKPDAKVLILGSMPGQKSLVENQYYAHPRNSFWPIMRNTFNADEKLNYEQCKKLLCKNKIALWDVLKSCYREGSLDSDIDHSTIEANDFKKFFSTHAQIKAVFFNGTKAEQLFTKYVLKDLEHKHQNLKYYRLPSTSPAHAAMTTDQKLLKWALIKKLI
jgi:double-stranded uracil-DNA glycosylase